MHPTTQMHSHDPDDDLTELGLKLQELEREHDEHELFPDAFMAEYTDFTTWDAFARRLAATPRSERAALLASCTRFSCYEQMEGTALESLIARKFGVGRPPARPPTRERSAEHLRLLP
jgi:hypothetical protein